MQNNIVLNNEYTCKMLNYKASSATTNVMKCTCTYRMHISKKQQALESYDNNAMIIMHG